MKKKNIQLDKKLILKKETLTLLTTNQQMALPGDKAAFASRLVLCDTLTGVIQA